mmetsp:Transcript_59546/g.104150  ORF Transcript_59546/g.104150 Transcript_59546/m.104150 type:complete len:214 (-) Transcript_59546:2442-3083(-)
MHFWITQHLQLPFRLSLVPHFKFLICQRHAGDFLLRPNRVAAALKDVRNSDKDAKCHLPSSLQLLLASEALHQCLNRSSCPCTLSADIGTRRSMQIILVFQSVDQGAIGQFAAHAGVPDLMPIAGRLEEFHASLREFCLLLLFTCVAIGIASLILHEDVHDTLDGMLSMICLECSTGTTGARRLICKRRELVNHLAQKRVLCRQILSGVEQLD